NNGGGCDVAENCTGTGAACPADSALAAGTVCRGSAGVCDPAETCNGSSAACPGNTFTAAGTVCRGSAGPCDPAESCTGSAAACPGNTLTAAGTVCRGSAGVCDVAETCNGASSACPADAFRPSSTVCRANSGAGCDVAENCTGSSAACPADGFTTAGTLCRGSAGPCDPAESCTGSAAACPGNAFTAAGTLCRGSAGPCDPAESCTGSAAACPGNTLTAAGTVCRASAGVCDVAETCNGASSACPADAFRPSSTVCRASSSIAACDPAESCTGSSALCPTNVITRAPTTEVCNGVDDNCSGVIDEGNPGGGGACTTGQPGLCSAGTRLCSGGTLVCNRNSAPTTEVCNGVDDNCDWTVDNIASSACSPGACRSGYTYCSGSSTLCAWSGNSPVGTACSGGRCDGAGTCRPTNDRPENATYLGSLPAGQRVTSGNTCGASTQPSAWCNGQSEIYYYVYVTRRSVLYVDTFGSTFDTVINVSSNGYDSYACNDDSCGTLQSQIAPGSPFVVNPGYYYIAVGGFVGSCGNFTLRVQAVPASNAVIRVGRGGGQVAYYSTAGQANMVNLGCGASGGDITFYWTLCPGIGGGTFSANTCSGYTTYDTALEYFDGTSGGAACNDDSCGLRSSLSVGVSTGPGIRAFYQDGWGGQVGNNYTVFSVP
ncbi:MAG: hypothetical protein IPN17_07525, partial [Deltaproteobacteria bacterium]|nr:hypothetical protein [Deltaproteobacteria bacterium]